jgi:hypothetical protein
MLKSTSLRWALLGSGLLFAGLGLGSCNLSSLTGVLPLALLGGLLANGANTGS